jgi:acyl carrier protein
LVGRADYQVKLRGFRIELGEIEAVLGTHESVRRAVVVVREYQAGDKRLVAYVVATAGEDVASIGVLRTFLQEKLPDYMIPSAFIFLDTLPLTANGKVDRRALPGPDLGRSRLETEFVAPRTQVEQVLAKIWCEVLGLERVGVHDNFFELGGHSLLTTQVVSEIHQELNVNLQLAHFFAVPTIAGLAKRVEALLWLSTGRPGEDEPDRQEREEGIV